MLSHVLRFICCHSSFGRDYGYDCDFYCGFGFFSFGCDYGYVYDLDSYYGYVYDLDSYYGYDDSYVDQIENENGVVYHDPCPCFCLCLWNLVVFVVVLLLFSC